MERSHGPDLIDELERRLVEARDAHTIALGGTELSEAARQHTVAQVRAITSQLRAEHRARYGQP